jgi:hypothetical protein
MVTNCGLQRERRGTTLHVTVDRIDYSYFVDNRLINQVKATYEQLTELIDVPLTVCEIDVNGFKFENAASSVMFTLSRNP